MHLLSSRALKHNFNTTKILPSIIDATCPKPKKCDPLQKYRSLDGSCNNLWQPKFGQKNSVYRRMLPSTYINGKFF